MTLLRLFMADQNMKKLVHILCDILVKVASMIFPTNFMILDYDMDFDVSTILRRPFLLFRRALVDMEIRNLKFKINDEHVTFNVVHSMRQSKEM